MNFSGRDSDNSGISHNRTLISRLGWPKPPPEVDEGKENTLDGVGPHNLQGWSDRVNQNRGCHTPDEQTKSENKSSSSNVKLFPLKHPPPFPKDVPFR
jgi:hypothetical protein